MQYLHRLASLTLLAGPLVASPAADSCVECRGRGDEVRLCEPHAKAESEALAALAPAVLAEDVGAAKAAVIALAKTCDGHRNAVTVELSRAVARGLEHASLEVRATALLAFVRPMDASVTEQVLDACTKAYPDQTRDLARRLAAAMDALGERTHTSIEALTLVQHYDAGRPESPSLSKECIYFQAYSDALFVALEKHGDAGLDRMLDLAPAARKGSVLPHRLVAGLVSKGRRDGVREGLTFLREWQESRQDLAGEIERLEGGNLPRAPDVYEGSAEDWRTQATRQREEKLKFLRESLEAHDAVGKMLQAPFGAMAIVSTRIEDAPPIGKTPFTEWSAWYRRHSKALPERLVPESDQR